MIRFFISKLKGFWPRIVFIFGKYSLRASQRYVELCQMYTLSKVTKQTHCSKKLFKCQYLRICKCQRAGKKSSFWSTNKLQSTYIYCLLWFQTLMFGILICLKWVQVIYTEKGTYRKSFVTSSCKGRKCTIDDRSWYFKYSYMVKFFIYFAWFYL